METMRTWSHESKVIHHYCVIHRRPGCPPLAVRNRDIHHRRSVSSQFSRGIRFSAVRSQHEAIHVTEGRSLCRGREGIAGWRISHVSIDQRFTVVPFVLYTPGSTLSPRCFRSSLSLSLQLYRHIYIQVYIRRTSVHRYAGVIGSTLSVSLLFFLRKSIARLHRFRLRGSLAARLVVSQGRIYTYVCI